MNSILIMVLTDVVVWRHALQRGAEAGGRRGSRLVTGVNLPMLLRAVSYRHEPLEAVISRAVVAAPRA
jgi:PTS system mannose-specific IIA component